MDLGLTGKIALVTGSGRGIGRAVARRLWDEGCSVAVNARGEDDLQSLSRELGARLSAHPADVTSPRECRRLLDDVMARWGRLDIIVCNVGDGFSVPPGQETQEEWQRVLSVNLASTTNLVEAARSSLESGSAIVCISSICGLAALGAPVTYSAAKAALNSYVRGIARPLAISGIRINAVAPGNILVEGGRWERRMESDPVGVKELLDREVPLRRFGRPEEIADIVAFLGSARAAFVTGAVWVADGGQMRS